jgi:hypothetical protein
MLYKKKTVNVRPQTIAPAPVVEQHVHDRETIIEHRGWSSEAIAMATIAGLVLFGLLLYYMWYRPAYVNTTPAVIERHNTVIEKPAPEPTTIITPPPVVNTTPPPVTDTPDVNITTPPVTIENHPAPAQPDTNDNTNTNTNEEPPTDAPPVVPDEGR